MQKKKSLIHEIFIRALALTVVASFSFFRLVWAAPGNSSGFAFGEKIGYIQWADGTSFEGALVSDSDLKGYLWSEKTGYISLSCSNAGSCATVNYGVSNDGSGNLSGYAWSEKLGWVSFDDSSANNFYQATVDGDTGVFSGYLWSEKAGWINLDDSGDLYQTSTTWRVLSAPTITNSTGAINIHPTDATAQCDLTSAGNASTTVYVYWGDNDGGTTAGNWDNSVNLGVQSEGVITTLLENLDQQTTYYYRCYASNSEGNDWADATANFATIMGSSPIILQKEIILKNGVILK